MHSRIIQISRKALDQSDYLTAVDVPPGFTDSVADYVQETKDRAQEVGIFLEAYLPLFEPGTSPEAFRVVSEGKRRYFRGRYQKFREVCALLGTMTLDAFIGDECGPAGRTLDWHLYELQEACSEKYGIYIYEGGELTPFCDWLRHAKPGRDYYFGSILSYHA